MATKQVCDGCGADITDKTSGALTGIPDADTEGGGNVEHSFDLCQRCYRAWVTWMQTLVAPTKRGRR